MKNKFWKILIATLLLAIIGYFLNIGIRKMISNYYYTQGLSEHTYEKAIENYSKAIKYNPQNIDAYIKKTGSLEDSIEIIALLDSAISENPKSIDIHLRKIGYLGKSNQTLSALNDIIKVYPDVNDNTYKEYLKKTNDYNYERNYYYVFENLYYKRAILNYSLGNLSSAMKDYDILTKSDFDNGFCGFYNRAFIFYRLKDYKNAILNINTAYDISKKLKSDEFMVSAILLLGCIHYQMGNYTSALKCFSSFNLKKNSGGLRGFFIVNKVAILIKIGDVAGATKECETAFKEKYFEYYERAFKGLDSNNDFIDCAFSIPILSLNKEIAYKACINLGMRNEANKLIPTQIEQQNTTETTKNYGTVIDNSNVTISFFAELKDYTLAKSSDNIVYRQDGQICYIFLQKQFIPRGKSWTYKGCDVKIVFDDYSYIIFPGVSGHLYINGNTIVGEFGPNGQVYGRDNTYKQFLLGGTGRLELESGDGYQIILNEKLVEEGTIQGKILFTEN